jgi:hypothetical protein
MKWFIGNNMSDGTRLCAKRLTLNALLIHRTIYGGLMRYDGKSGKFQKA